MKRQIHKKQFHDLNDFAALADELDRRGFTKGADLIEAIIKKIAKNDEYDELDEDETEEEYNYWSEQLSEESEDFGYEDKDTEFLENEPETEEINEFGFGKDMFHSKLPHDEEFEEITEDESDEAPAEEFKALKEQISSLQSLLDNPALDDSLRSELEQVVNSLEQQVLRLLDLYVGSAALTGVPSARQEMPAGWGAGRTGMTDEIRTTESSPLPFPQASNKSNKLKK